MATPNNPLQSLAWAGQAGVNPPAQTPQQTNFQMPQGAGGMNPGNLANPTTNIKDMWRNQTLQQTQQNAYRNQMIPAWANQMQGYAGGAGNVFANFANLGSPYYQQQQAASFGQGVQQGQNAQALARQQLAAQGQGYTPTGQSAAMIGGMGQAQAQNLNLAFLQNLFQNEQLQMAGAQGLAGIAGLFNPASLFGGQTGQSTQGPTAASQFSDVMGGLFGGGGAAGGKGVKGLGI